MPREVRHIPQIEFALHHCRRKSPEQSLGDVSRSRFESRPVVPARNGRDHNTNLVTSLGERVSRLQDNANAPRNTHAVQDKGNVHWNATTGFYRNPELRGAQRLASADSD